VIDARDEEMGAWFEARIVKISPVSSRASMGSADNRHPQASTVGGSSKDTGSNDDAGGSVTSLNTDDAADDGFQYSIVFETQSVFIVFFHFYTLCSILREG